MRDAPTNLDEVIDSRDVIARIEELHAVATDETADSNERAHANNELGVLQNLQEQAESSPDWPHGESLIRDSYFKHYAQELAEDCRPFPRDSAEGEALNMWPYRCIDWEQAARELKQDYFTVDFDGVDYWIRG